MPEIFSKNCKLKIVEYGQVPKQVSLRNSLKRYVRALVLPPKPRPGSKPL